MPEEKANCYTCTHRGTVPGDAHSCCRYPGTHTDMFDIFLKQSENMEVAKKIKHTGKSNRSKEWMVFLAGKFRP